MAAGELGRPRKGDDLRARDDSTMVTSEEWSTMLHQSEHLREKYFGDVSPEDIMEQFNRLDEE